MTARRSTGLQACNGKLYSIGGYYNGQTTLEIYNIATNSWSTGASSPIPLGYVVSDIYNNDKIYCISGNGSTEVRTVQVYNTSNDTWGTIYDKPTAEVYGSAVVNGNMIYCLGKQMEVLSIW